MKKKNYMEELVDYIKDNLKKGYTKESLKWALINQGHSNLEVEKALKLVETQLSNEAPVLETKPTIKYEVVEPKQQEKKSFWERLFG